MSAVLAEQLRRHSLLRDVKRLGLAVSGGADSVALFRLMASPCQEAGVAVAVLHLNHGLRAEADADEQFVRELAAEANVPFLASRAQLALRPPDGLSLEMSARAARLAFFQRCSAEAQLDAVATGHQADDTAETLLLRLARGAGASGLSGLRPRSQVSGCAFIRPLLAFSGAALRAWLQRNGFGWREDASNRDVAIPRNYVRHSLLPLLERSWAPDLRERLCQSAEALREDDLYLDALAEQQLAGMHATVAGGASDALPAAALLRLPPALQRRVLRQWLFRQGLAEAAGIDTVLALLEACRADNAWRHALPGNAVAACQAGLLRIALPDSQPPEQVRLPATGTVQWAGLEITTENGRGVASVARGIGCLPAVCTLSAAAAAEKGLQVRARLPGDRIAPTGLRGSKKIQDLFVDAKIAEHQRDAIPLVVSGDEVVWVPGYRVAQRFAVPTADAPSLRITVRARPSPARPSTGR